MAAATVSAGYAKHLLDFAVSRDASERQLLERSGIRTEDLEDPDNRISFARYVALMKASKDLCDAPSLALHLGAASDFDKVSIVGLIIYRAATMAEALAQLNRFSSLVAEVDVTGADERFELARRDGDLWLEDMRADPNRFPELTESTFARLICENARQFPGTPFARLLHVTHPEPHYGAEYRELLKVPVVFDSDRNALQVEESWLSLELSQPNRYAFGVLSRHAEALLESLERSKATRGQVESLLIPRLHQGDLGMAPIAKEMGLSRQTLYRRLKEENVTFEAVLDELRHKMALHYLGGRKVSVNETAYLVGFSDPSSFSRAFKRWTGRSPGRRLA